MMSSQDTSDFFAASGTAHVANGGAITIVLNAAAKFTWSSNLAFVDTSDLVEKREITVFDVLSAPSIGRQWQEGRMGRTAEEIAALRVQVDAVPHWYHVFDFGDGIVTPGTRNGTGLLKLIDLPDDMTGMRVLDLGARDGFFSFTCEQRGAREVIATDYLPRTSMGFDVAARALQSTRVSFIHANIYDLPAHDLGMFDIVLFLGLLYHLPDPLGALRIVRSLTAGTMHLETQAIDSNVLMPDGSFEPLPDRLKDVPLLQFYPCGVLYGDSSNFFAPNTAGLTAILHDTGFAPGAILHYGDRAVVSCRAVENAEATLRHRNARQIVW
jgi:tRNA (mo5U34)-methyltransferase